MYFYPFKLSKSDFDSLGISITAFNKVIITDDWVGNNTISHFSRLYYVKSGRAVIFSDSTEIEMTEGNIYLIPAGVKFSHTNSTNIEKIYLHFTLPSDKGDIMRTITDICALKKDKEYINRIFSLFSSESPLDAFMLKSLICADVCEFLRLHYETDKSLNNYSPIISNTINSILKNPKISMTANTLAREQYVSVSFLSKLFKKETGVTIGKFIDQATFSSVQTALAESEKSIEEISAYYGFCDRFYFSARFKKLFGETPVKYRKKFKIYK